MMKYSFKMNLSAKTINCSFTRQQKEGVRFRTFMIGNRSTKFSLLPILVGILFIFFILFYFINTCILVNTSTAVYMINKTVTRILSMTCIYFFHDFHKRMDVLRFWLGYLSTDILYYLTSY